MRCLFSYKIIQTLLFLSIHSFAFPQSRPLIQPDPKIRFIIAAPDLVPRLVREGKWEELQNFLENWKRSGGRGNELIFSVNVLMSIETREFAVYDLPCDYLFFLDQYAALLRNKSESPALFQYSIRISDRYAYDASNDVRKLLLYTSSWARHLIDSRSLDRNQFFLCRAIAGETSYPSLDFSRNRHQYIGLDSLQQTMDYQNERYYMGRHDGEVGTVAVMTGIWMPTGKLQILGNHPSVGILLGVRSHRNEFDLLWSFRFLHPTPGAYTFVRNDTSYRTNYYDGGYIGFDYTRYLFYRKRFEFGWTSAVAYDYFSVASGFGTSSFEHHPSPLNVGSFDFNTGFRIKYFLRGGSFIGLAAKYHFIHYSNDGGTDLTGNGATIDLIYGSH